MSRTAASGATVVTVLAAVVLAGGCTGRPGEPPRPVGPVARVLTEPGDRAAGVSPVAPVSVNVRDGQLRQVTLTGPEGGAVRGTLSADRRTWTSAEPLGYDTAYRWGGTAVGTDSRAAVERTLQVRASVPVEGSWAWLPDDGGRSRVHYRPREYWPPGTRVSVSAPLYGRDYGAGSYGKEDLTTHFTVGRAQIVRADVESHRMVVVRDGAVVMDFPASYGLGSDPRRNTTGGVHVVMSKAQMVLMSNPDYGYVDVPEYWSVRISNNGEFIHANPQTTGVQGSSNITHGCVNLSTANAREYFASAIFGDPVEVTNSPVPMSAADGDIYDWTIPWEQWRAMSALHP